MAWSGETVIPPWCDSGVVAWLAPAALALVDELSRVSTAGIGEAFVCGWDEGLFPARPGVSRGLPPQVRAPGGGRFSSSFPWLSSRNG